mgnify:CR=1 FL=1
MIDFKNKNILITGGSGGIGKELVKKFLSLGGNVLGSGTSTEKLDLLKKQYQKIKVKKFDIENHSRIAEFIDNVYGEVLNDWIHFMATHSHQIEDIHDELMSKTTTFGGCRDGISCALFLRHFDGDRDRSNDIELDSNSDDGVRTVFYGELFDRIHHFLYHLFDAAMRTRRETVDGLKAEDEGMDIAEDSKDGGHGFVDGLFAAKRRALSERREKLKAVTDRYDETKHSKFNITTAGNDGVSGNGNGNGNGTERGIAEKRKPFIDALNEYLFQRQCAPEMVDALRSLIVEHQFDSDAVAEDLDHRRHGAPSSNLIEAIRANGGGGGGHDDDDQMERDDVELLIDYVQRMKRMLSL